MVITVRSEDPAQGDTEGISGAAWEISSTDKVKAVAFCFANSSWMMSKTMPYRKGQGRNMGIWLQPANLGAKTKNAMMSPS